MGIETLLTILVTAAILVAASALCLLVLGLARAATLFRGDGVFAPNRGRHAIDAGVPGIAVRDAIGRIVEGMRTTSLFLVAALYNGARKGAARFMGWWENSALPSLRETASATYDLATFYRSRPEEMPYLAEISLVPTYDPKEETPRWTA